MLDATPTTMQSVLQSSANKKAGTIGDLANISAQLIQMEDAPKLKFWNIWSIIKWVKKIIKLIELAREFFKEEIQTYEIKQQMKPQ